MIEPGKTVVIPIVEPPMTVSEFVARAERYGNAPWQASQQISTNIAIANGQFKVYRRVLGIPKTEHCEDCPPLAAMGWQPIGTLPSIGDTECNGLCLCHFRFAESPGQQEFFQGKKGLVPAPREATPLPDDEGVYMIAEPPGVKLPYPVAGPPK